MSTLVRSLTTDFGGLINERKLHDEIEENENITTAFTALRVDYPDTIYLYFGATPTAGEITELDTVIIPAHDNVRDQGDDIDNVGVGDNSNDYITATTATYTEKKRYFYNSKKGLKHIVLALWVDSGSTGSVRIVNCKDDKVVAEITDIVETEETAYDMGPLGNLPKKRNQRLRIEMKVDTGVMYMSALANDYH